MPHRNENGHQNTLHADIKLIEIRDSATQMVALAQDLSALARCFSRLSYSEYGGLQLLSKVGIAADASPQILLVHLDDARSNIDPYSWGDRTMQTVHRALVKYWSQIPALCALDVQMILGERERPEQAPWLPLCGVRL